MRCSPQRLESQARYRSLNREKISAAKKVAYALKRDQILADRRAEYHSGKRDILVLRMREAHKKDPRKQMVWSAKKRAVKIGVPFNLRWQDINMPTHCPILGLKFETSASGGSDNSPTIDRIIPSVGYIASNVHVICMKANRIKNNATASEVQAVANFLWRTM
jgi:hypothetical protein